MRRLKRISFSMHTLNQGLKPKIIMAMFEALPQDFSIVGWGGDFSSMVSYWIVQSKEFQETEMGFLIPEAILKFTEDGDYLRCEMV